MTLFFAAGIWWGKTNHFSILVLLFFITTVYILLQKNKVKSIVKTGLFLLFFMVGSFRIKNQEKKHYLFFKNIYNKNHIITGTINSINKSNHIFYKRCININNVKIIKNKKIKSFDYGVNFYINKLTNLKIGDNIEIKNIIFKEPKNKSFTDYTIKESKITAFSNKNITIKKLNSSVKTITLFLSSKKSELLKSFRKKMQKKTFTLFSSIFLGNKLEVKKELNKEKQYFKLWGILHYLARSGLHLVIFVWIWQLILMYIPLSFFIKKIIILFLGVIYCLFSWPSTPFIRAFLLFFLYNTSSLTNFKTHFLHGLTLVSFLVLFTNPIQLFFLDFQLSYGITIALAWFNHIIAQNKSLKKAKDSCL